MRWHDIEKDGDPVQFNGEKNSWAGSDEHYLVVLENKWITVSYFFVDSFGHWWSSQFEPYDKYYNAIASDGKETAVTHWAKMPKLPKVETENDN